jgi:hypothetical protein
VPALPHVVHRLPHRCPLLRPPLPHRGALPTYWRGHAPNLRSAKRTFGERLLQLTGADAGAAKTGRRYYYLEVTQEGGKYMDEAQHIPPASLMAEVAAEERIIGTKEAQALQHNILTAVNAYYEYLNQNGLFFDHERELLRASALIVTCDMNGEIEIVLKDGAIDRRYGTGGDPDPEGRNLNPTRWMP